MFTKIQKYLLINHPLLWNTKIVPALSFAILFHILFFVIGYVYGNVDFTDENYYRSDFSTGVIIFFSIYFYGKTIGTFCFKQLLQLGISIRLALHHCQFLVSGHFLGAP